MWGGTCQRRQPVANLRLGKKNLDGIENPIRKPLIYLVVIAAILLPTYLLFDSYICWRNDSYRQHIPPEVEVASLIDSGSTWNVRSGCGAAIFELTVKAKEKLSVAGITALNDGVDDVLSVDTSGRFGVWQETPYTAELIPESDWAASLGCTWIKAELHKVIYAALRKKGSFYRRYKNGTVLVVPTSGIVVYTFMG